MDQPAHQPNAALGVWANYSPPQRWMFLSVLFLAATSSLMDRGVISMVFEPLKAEFQLSDSMLGVLGGAPFGICFALSSIPLARLADRYGRKVVLFWSVLAWSLMTGLCGLATTLPFLILARMGVGLAEGGSHPPAHALIADYFPPNRRGMAFAVFNLSGTAGMVAATSLGGWITATYGWRMAFFVMAALSAPIALLVLAVLRESHVVDRGVAGRAATFKADWLALARKKTFVLVLCTLFFYSALPYGVLVFTPSYMVRVLALDLAVAGAMFGGATAVGAVVGSLAGGYLNDWLRKHDERWLLRLPAYMLAADAFVSVAAFSVNDTRFFVALQVLNATLVFGCFPSIIVAVQHVCGSGRRASATAAAGVVLNAFGVSLAPIAAGVLSDAFAPWAGVLALRYAMIAMCCALAPAAWCLYWASRYLHLDHEA